MWWWCDMRTLFFGYLSVSFILLLIRHYGGATRGKKGGRGGGGGGVLGALVPFSLALISMYELCALETLRQVQCSATVIDASVKACLSPVTRQAP